MIPKVIHYCWFGRGAKPKSAEKCIASWRKFLPDYEIKEWNEDNYDVQKIPYIAEAYKAKKYAFVSDYARFDILYHNGGLYFDTDVEVIRSIDDIVAQGAYMGLECDFGIGFSVAPGLGMSGEPGLEFYREMLNVYSNLHFKNEDGTCNLKTIVQYTTEALLSRGLIPAPGILECAGMRIYPSEYFNPMLPNGKIVITSNTRTIHHYSASWHTSRERMLIWIRSRFGVWPMRAVGLLTRNPFTVPSRIFKFLRAGK